MCVVAGPITTGKVRRHDHSDNFNGGVLDIQLHDHTDDDSGGVLDIQPHDHSDDDTGGDVLSYAIKVHRAADIVPINTDWNDIVFDLKIDSETLPGIGFLNEGEVGEDKSILVVEADRLLQVFGCVHPEWIGGPATVEYATRILTSKDNGSTWVESRCLQIYAKKSRTADDAGSRAYAGSILAEKPTLLKMQYKVSNVNLIFSGWSGFDNGVAITLSIKG